MFDSIKKDLADSFRSFIKGKNSRVMVLGVFLFSLFAILVARLYHLQIMEGEDYQNEYILMSQRQQRIPATRGRIFDRNGELLAEDRLSYNLILEDLYNYPTKTERQGSLNGIAFRLIQIVGDSSRLNRVIPIETNKEGGYQFTEEGFQRNRFKADLFGRLSTDDLTEEEREMTADDIVQYMCSQDMFMVGGDNRSFYRTDELEAFGLPENLSGEELLQILNIRYGLYLNSYQRYLPFVVAEDISQEAVAAVLEHRDQLTGADVQESSIRVYYGGESLSAVLGYTGLISSEELKNQKEDSEYTAQSVIGKSGIEKAMESQLKGKDGAKQVYIDAVGRRRSKSEIISQAEAGNDVYLTIDRDLQEAVYQMLEQQIAGILLANMVNEWRENMETPTEASQIRIPVDDVYAAFFTNHVLDIDEFQKEDASQAERQVWELFKRNKETVLVRLKAGFDVKRKGSDPDDDLWIYLDYIVDKLRQQEILQGEGESFSQYDGSLREYLSQAAVTGRIHTESLEIQEKYTDMAQLEAILESQILDGLREDDDFDLLVYERMVREGILSPAVIFRLLYDQGILQEGDEDYDTFLAGRMSEWEFIRKKIRNLEITPAQLALEPCSGAAVVTDPENGQVLACVSYPGYDNNRLANEIDSQYYQKLLHDRSLPLFNRAVSQLTAPGSTFKPVTVAAGLTEGVILPDTAILCDGVFDKVSPSLRCWNRAGHGIIPSAASALRHSCNDYLCDIVYQAGSRETGTFSEEEGLNLLRQYASMFDLDKSTGIEIGEASPHVTDQYAIPSAIGQGTHNYTAIQIARYTGTLANRGTSYQLSLVSHVTDWEGNMIERKEPEVESRMDLPEMVWDNIEEGMGELAATNQTLKTLKISVAGKTGTAEESKTHPNHGWFIGFAPRGNPQIALTVRIANGYSSGNVVGVGRDIFNYYFGLEPKESILTGQASQVSNNVRTD